jgi:hypothetical protein
VQGRWPSLQESVSISQNSHGHLLPEVVNVGSFHARITFQVNFYIIPGNLFTDV